MSRVYFHSEHGEAELWGGERAWLGGLCSDIATGLMGGVHQSARWRTLIRPGHYLLDERHYPSSGGQAQFMDSLACSLRVGWDDAGVLTWKGKGVDPFSLLLNTACKVGNDAVKLAARIHGQCEIHAYIEGTDRAWVAGIIGGGLASGVFRRDIRKMGGGYAHGWEEVSAFLLGRDDEPVVMSYSVCEQFPDRYEAGWEPPGGTDLRPSWTSEDDWAGMTLEQRENHHNEGRDERWSELPDDERWRIAMDALRAKPGGLRLDPADWDSFHFGHGLTTLDLLAPDYDERLDKALEIADKETR